MESKMVKLFNKVWRDERGVSALEYAVLAAVVIAAVITAGAELSTGLTSVFTSIMTKLTNAVGT